MKTLTTSLISLLLFCDVAWGFTYLVNSGCRDGRIIRSRTSNLLLNEVSFPTGSGAETSFVRALTEYNTDVIGSNWRWFNGKDNDQFIVWPDNRSEVAFVAPNQFPCSAANPACAITQYEYEWSWSEWCSYIRYIRESDIFYNNGFRWSAAATAPQFPIESIEAQGLHELGHAMSLQHEPNQIAVMGAGTHAFFGTNRNDPQLHSDEKTAVRFLYGNTTSNQFDVATHGFFQSSTAGEYGAIANLAVSPVVNRGAGQLGWVDYTVENHSPAATTFRTSFELGTPGNWIQVAAPLINLPGGRMTTRRQFFTVPAALPANQRYFVRVVVDDNQQLAETNETNNETIYLNRMMVQ